MSGHDLPHHSDNKEHRSIGIFISVLAVFMAVVSALAKKEANEMILKEVQASNGFAWYQSKRQRGYLNELEIARIDRDLAGAPNEAQRGLLAGQRAKLAVKNAEYGTENVKILQDSETDRGAAELAGHKHHRFEFAEIALHVAVVLASLTLLTDSKKFFWIGIVCTALGAVLTLLGLMVQPHTPTQSAPAGAPAKPAH